MEDITEEEAHALTTYCNGVHTKEAGLLLQKFLLDPCNEQIAMLQLQRKLINMLDI